jgi:hypothetical protein
VRGGLFETLRDKLRCKKGSELTEPVCESCEAGDRRLLAMRSPYCRKPNDSPVSRTVRFSCLRRCLAFDFDALSKSWQESSLSPKVPETFSWSQKTLKGHLLVVCCDVVEASIRRDKVRCNPLWNKHNLFSGRHTVILHLRRCNCSCRCVRYCLVDLA